MIPPRLQPATLTAGTTLAEAAERLGPFLDHRSRQVLADAVARAQAGRARVLVLGEAKRGKSSLVNAVTGASLLPTGALPLTSVATVVRVGDQPDARARTRDGSWRSLAVNEVADLVSERGNPGNRKKIDHVEITVVTDRLPPGTEVVDTPGTGSVHELNTVEADRAREVLDLAVLVVSVDPPLARAELELLTEAHDGAARCAVVINKIDLAGRAQVEEVAEFTRSVLAERIGDIPVFPLSARTGHGVEHFVAWLDTQVRAHGARDADASARDLLRRLGNAALDRVAVERELRRGHRDDARTRQQALEEVLARGRGRTAAAADGIHGENRRLRRELDSAHRRAVAQALAAARATQPDPPTDAPASASPEAAAASGRNLIAERAGQEAHRWFEQQSAKLRTGLETAAAGTLDRLRAELTVARSSAGDLLDLQLGEIATAEPLTPWNPPALTLSAGPAWTELVTATLARYLPAGWRRRRVRRDLHRWIDATVPRLFGQARSLLQRELAAATRVLTHAVNHEWERQLAALEQGLDAVRGARNQLDEQDADRDKTLISQEHELRHTLALLDE